jgi:quercetin dioxygenase-like cupin family protein
MIGLPKPSLYLPWPFLLALLSACPDGAGPPPRAPDPLPPAAPKPPPEPLPTPIEADLPTMVPPTLPQRAVCRAGTCTLSRLVPEELRKSMSAKGPLLLWEEMIGSKARVTIPTDKEATVAGVVLEGSVGLLSREKQWGKPARMTQWQGFHAPGAGVTLVAMDKKPARIALVIAAAGADGSLAKHIERWSKSKKGLEWKKREKPLESIDFMQIQPVSWAKGAYHARIGWEASGKPEGAPPASGNGTAAAAAAPGMMLNMLRFSKDARWAAHVHEKSQECLAVLEGDGELSLTLGPAEEGAVAGAGAVAVAVAGGGAGAGAAANEKRLALEPGMVVCIPEGMWHAWKPSGQAAFLALQVFSPPGPEQGFKSLAAKGP